MEVRLDLRGSPFNLEHTLRCGQVFRWRKGAEWWYGVVEGEAVAVRQGDDVLMCRTEGEGLNGQTLLSYFGLNDDLNQILTEISKDEFIKGAVHRFRGLRIIRQDPWECLISYLCSVNASIAAIEGMLSRLCLRFGRKTTLWGEVLHTFPTPERLRKAELSDLLECRLGFRARYVLEAAKRIDEGEVSLREVAGLRYEEARRRLAGRLKQGKLLPGVGPKVADCVLLFSMGKTEAFPVDRWVKRAVAAFYPHLFDLPLRRGSPPSAKEYETISSIMRGYFGPWAGYAQEYLYYYARSSPTRGA